MGRVELQPTASMYGCGHATETQRKPGRMYHRQDDKRHEGASRQKSNTRISYDTHAISTVVGQNFFALRRLHALTTSSFVIPMGNPPFAWTW